MLTSLFLSCLLLAQPTTAEATDPVSAEISALVEDLADPSFRTRRQALRALREFGESARPALEAALESDDAEVRASAKTLLEELNDASRLAPTRVSLTLDDVPPEEALAALEEAIGYRFSVEPENWVQNVEDRRVSVDLESVSLLDAVRAVVPQCGLSVGQHGSAQLRGWGDSDWPQYPTVDAGIVRIEARSISLNHNASINLAHDARTTNTNGQVQFLVMVEPKLNVVGEIEVVFDEAIDANGEDLLERNAFGHHTYYYHNDSSGGVFHFANQSLGLEFTADRPRQLRKLAGNVVLQIEKDSDEFIVDDPLQSDGTKSYLKTDLYINPLQTIDEGFSVEVKIDNPGQITSERSFLQGLRLEMSDGHVLQPMVRRSSHGGLAVEATLHYRWRSKDDADVPTPARLVWHVPLKLEAQSIPFEFSDLPLP